MKTYAYDTEAEAVNARRALIQRGAVVSMIAPNPDDNDRYTFDADERPVAALEARDAVLNAHVDNDNGCWCGVTYEDTERRDLHRRVVRKRADRAWSTAYDLA